jgi:hippurate hydrolase
MDALPMQEETGLPFASQVPGAMHACGHDAHTAMLVGAARALCARRDQLPGTVVFMFQPGEEGYHGARHMIADGLLDDVLPGRRPDAAFALHIWPNMPRGLVTTRPGPLLASTDTLGATITGKGGHAAMPHDSLDPIPVACEIVSALQAVIARTVPVTDPRCFRSPRSRPEPRTISCPNPPSCWARFARCLRNAAPRSAPPSRASSNMSRPRTA